MSKQHFLGGQHTFEFAGSFSLSITQALREQLILALGMLSPAALNEGNIAAIEKKGGIYQLFLEGSPVYIGKSTNSLYSRIGNHLRKLSGRTPGLLERMQFRVLYVNEDLDALAPEKMLIRALKSTGRAPWNQNGFGNKDPGRQRDTSLVKIGHFDRDFPINLDFSLRLSGTKPIQTLLDALEAIKAALPYNLRFPSAKDSVQRELAAIDVSAERVHDRTMTVAGWLSFVASRLPTGWMITAFPGYLIIYRETQPERYASRQQTWIANGHGSYSHASHVPEFDTEPMRDMQDDADDAY